ncbi:RNA 2',3'-cyclic phosphodiesterase [Chitinibacteraceae bacterium HSL-7]
MTETLRCFIALPLPPELRTQLARYGTELQQTQGGRLMRTTNLHLTLAFIGDIDAEQARELSGELADLSLPHGDLVLDHVGHFGPQHRAIVYAGGATTPELNTCNHEVRRLLRSRCIHFDDRPLVPHVTLLRDALGTRAPLIPPLSWAFTQPQLFISTKDHGGGIVYQALDVDDQSGAMPP